MTSFRALLLFVLVLPVQAQDSLDVTFRFLPDLSGAVAQPIVQAFLPGAFNDWGQPYVSGVNGARIANNHPSRMTYEAARNEYAYTKRLRVGSAYAYKVQYHTNTNQSSGAGFVWTADPLNPVTVGQNGDSQVTIADPMVFQLAREQEGTGEIRAVSASLFTTAPITALTFEVNGVQRDGLPHFTTYGSGPSGLLRFVLPAPVAPGAQFKVTATDSRGRTITSSIGTIPPTVVDEKRPAGLRDGITYDNATRVARLSLFAPHKQYAYVLSPQNDWTPSPAFLMKRDSVNADSVYFWIELENVPLMMPFQYLVDGLIRVADPYSEDIINPGEPDYPTGKTEHPVTVITGPLVIPVSGCDAGPYKRPEPKDLVIYELLLRDFQDAHSFNALADTLDYLKKLGVTAIELMPVSEFDGDLSWGYNPAFHFAVDGYYGSRESLHNLVQEAHCRGMAVILDVVYNHATGQSPLVRLWNASPTGSPSATPTPQNPYANVAAHHPFNVFNDLDHSSPATRYWLDRANRYWLETFHVDGFRYDLSKGFTQCTQGGPNGCPNNQGLWDSYDASRIYNLKRMADSVWSYAPDALLILEHLSQGTEERELAAHGTDRGHPGFLLWRKMMGPFNEATMGYHNSSNTAGAYFGAGGQGFSIPNTISILEDHDEQRLMRKNARYGNTGPDGYNVKSTATSLDRMKAAGAFFFTLPGPKMIWQFGELGYGAADDECLPEQDGCPGSRTGVRDDGWAYRGDSSRYALYQTWAALMNLRKAHPVFTSPQTVVELSTAGATKRIKLSLDTLQVVVVGNFDVQPRDVTPAFHQSGTWYSFFGRDMVEVTDANAALTLAPGAFQVFTSHFLGYAPRNIVVGVDGGEVPSEMALMPVRPNPARAQATVAFALPQAGAVRLEVYDLLGRRVMTLLNEMRPAGQETRVLDVSHLSAGLYVLRLETASAVQTQPLVVVR